MRARRPDPGGTAAGAATGGTATGDRRATRARAATGAGAGRDARARATAGAPGHGPSCLAEALVPRLDGSPADERDVGVRSRRACLVPRDVAHRASARNRQPGPRRVA